MNGYIVGLVTFLAGLATAALGELLSEEIRDRLDRIPHAVLRLAARLADPAERSSMYDDEWVPELTYILKGTEARPITRLISGISYSLGAMAGKVRGETITGRIRIHHYPAQVSARALQSASLARKPA